VSLAPGTRFCPDCGEAVPPPEPQESAYHTVAETVGLVPSVRKKDNLYQGLFVLIFTAIAVVVGLVWQGLMGALVGALLGLIVSGVLSGLVLMVLGLMRAGKR